METTTEPLVVGVRFSKVGKVYHFAADALTDIKVGDMVVVETTRGWQLGQVAQILQNVDPPPDGWKPIDRRATPRDLLLRQMWQAKEAEVMNAARERATELRLSGIKIISAEYSFDGSRLIILFSSETEEKYDLKSLRSDMQKAFAPSQVEMRQIGPRDVAKTLCGMGACGLEKRCCCLFLTEFSSISIRMAKEQGISLTPTEITGMCGRLRCCLIYEYDNYVEARSKLPKRNKRVHTPQGEGKVVEVIPLRGAVLVDLPEVGVREFPGDEVHLVDGDGAQRPAPFTGTQKPSEIDQALTGDESEKPFVITAETPAPASDWENPPTVEQPRSMPRPERPAQGSRRQGPPGTQGGGQQEGRQSRDTNDRRGRPQSPGKEQPGGGDTDSGGQGNRGRGPQARRPANRPGGPQDRRDAPRKPQPKDPNVNDSRKGRPQNSGAEPDGEKGGSPNRPPSGPRSSTGGPVSRGDSEQRRRKGRRRDNSDNSSGNSESRA
jgi:cell fate regulator YaaT (PSP1 superfamily)